MRIPTSQYIDHPSLPSLKTLVSYWGITDSAGAADGKTLVCSNLAGEPTYQSHYVKVLTGDAAGQCRLIVNDTTNALGTVVVDRPFSDSGGAAELITASTLFVIVSTYDSRVIWYGTSTGAGAADGSTLVDTGLATPFTVDDQCIGYTVLILDCTTASLEYQEREVYDYDYPTSTLFFNTPFTSQVPVATTYLVLLDRPSSGGGPGPQPEPTTEETSWLLGWYDNFDVADATADTEKWSSEYVSAGAADGTADINTTTASKLYVDILAAAVAAAEYGVRAIWPVVTRKWFDKIDASVVVANPNANDVWAGLSVSRGVIWDANNYIRIVKYQDNVPNEGIAVVYRLAGGAVVTTDILSTTQDNLAFKIERTENVWRLFYSLTQAPRHHWRLALEVEDSTNSMTDRVSTYLSVYNPEDAAGQRISCNFDKFEHYETLGNFLDMVAFAKSRSGSLVYMGYCDTGMAASTSAILCSNLAGFTNDAFNQHYYMWVIKNASALGVAPDGEFRLITDYVSATGTFTTNIFTANVEAGDIVLVIHEVLVGPFVTINAIYDIVNALLVTSETGGTVTTDGTEQNLYVNNIPQGAYKPIVILLDCTNMIAGDAVTLKTYKRVSATGGLLADSPAVDLVGAQSPAVKEIKLSPTRHGIRTTMQRIAGAADRAYTWSVFLDA